MQKMRLIGTAIALLILLFTMFPIPSIVISVVCIFSYVCFTYFSKKNQMTKESIHGTLNLAYMSA